MGLSIEDKKQYLDDSEDRERIYIKQIQGLYRKAKEEITNTSLSFFNSRRYLDAKDENARARAAKRDKGIQSISDTIAKLGLNTLKLINSSVINHYNSEGVILTDLWTENSQDFFTMTFEKANTTKQKEIVSIFYMGLQYPEWQRSATNTAQDSWIKSSRGIMSSNKREVGKVQPSMQLTSNLRKTIDTMESKATSLINGALSETVRILIKDTQGAVLKGEVQLAKALIKRGEKWL